jgi:hypothetical protein
MSFGTVVWAIGAVVLFFFLWRVGVGLLRSMTEPLPPPPPPGEMRRISVRYRCGVCGLELKMTLAQEEDPDPPRHCMEEMDQISIDEAL